MAGLKGTANVLRKLNKAIKDQRSRTKKGLHAAGLVIKKDSVEKTPIDYGNLRSSAFVMVTNMPLDTSSLSFKGEDADDMAKSFASAVMHGKVIVGSSEYNLTGIVAYGAYYALYVHEAPMTLKGEPRSLSKKRGNYWDGGENKFLISSIEENKDKIVKILAKYAKV